MFEAAVTKFVREVGKESLIPVPSLDGANECRPLQVVVKKNRRWFWQSPKYEPSPFHISQLMVSKDSFDDVKVDSRELTTYNKTSEFSVKGKTGAKLVSLLELELDGSDKINVEAKFGEITKLEVDQPTLMTKFDQGGVDVKHEFIEQVRTDPRKVLCVVVGSAQLAADATVHMHINKEGEAKEDIDTHVKNVDEEVDVTVGDVSEKDLLIPAKTPLAFNICELLLKVDGSAELMVESDSLGGFEDFGDSVDAGQQESILEGMPMEEQYELIKNLPPVAKLDLTTSILNMCTTPVDVDTLLKLLKDAQRSAGSSKTGELKVRGEIHDAQMVLEAAGFQFEANGMMTYPVVATPMLETLRSVFEALIELDDDSTVALSRCPRDFAGSVLGMLEGAIEGTPMTINDPSASNIYLSKNAGRDFVTILGFHVTDAAYVVTTLDNRAELEGAWRAVYALLYEPPKPHKSRCAIL